MALARSAVQILWLVEAPGQGESALAPLLIGNFAIRAFASLASMTRISRLRRTAPPDAILIERSLVDLGALTPLTSLPWSKVTTLLVIGREDDGGVWRLPDEERQLANFGVRLVALPRSMAPHDALAALVRELTVGSPPSRRDTLTYRDLELDVERLRLRVLPSNDPGALTLTECRLLRLLLNSPGACHSRDQIKQAVWAGVAVTPRTVDSHVSRLRRRLDGSEVRIESIYGGGYVLR